MPEVRLEPTSPVFERAKTFHVLDRAATVIALYLITLDHFQLVSNSLFKWQWSAYFEDAILLAPTCTVQILSAIRFYTTATELVSIYTCPLVLTKLYTYSTRWHIYINRRITVNLALYLLHLMSWPYLTTICSFWRSSSTCSYQQPSAYCELTSCARCRVNIYSNRSILSIFFWA
jgi:hypothetical protein